MTPNAEMERHDRMPQGPQPGAEQVTGGSCL